jgi:uncharacterized MAPEG superfamily protein
MTMTDYPAFPAFCLALVALFLKTTMTSLLQIGARFRTRSFSAPEDAKLAGVAFTPRQANIVERCNSVWRNDVENLPLFLALALTYVLLGASLASASKLFAAYVVLRYLHTAVYLRGLQPWRAVFYLAGLAICCAIAVQIIRMVLVSSPA